jgi:IS5 family transposase
MLNLKHLQVKLAVLIDWEEIRHSFVAHFESAICRSVLPHRMFAGLLYLQLVYDYSNEMLMVSIYVARKVSMMKALSVDRVIVDTTVLPKAIVHPTDIRLLDRSRQHFVKLTKGHDITLRQNYNFESPGLATQVGYHINAKQYPDEDDASYTENANWACTQRNLTQDLSGVRERPSPIRNTAAESSTNFDAKVERHEQTVRDSRIQSRVYFQKQSQNTV